MVARGNICGNVPRCNPVQPTEVYNYVDCLRLWLRGRLNVSELKWLKPRCGGKKMRVHNHPARFDPLFIQRVTLFQPTAEALEFFGRRNDVHLTYVELSMDWIFDNEQDKEEAFKFVCAHLIKKYHRDQGIRFVGQDGKFTRYSGPRGSPNLIAVYADQPSKITGEVDCLHLDWRTCGNAALRRAGIDGVRDLVNFDHHAFWQKRLLLRRIDLRSLGRAYCNDDLGTNDRRSIVSHGRFTYDEHARAGSIISRALGSTQAVVDAFRRKFRVNRCLIPIDVRHLLPEPS